MPDGHDYRAFFDLLDHPEAWTDRDRKQVEWMLVQQRELLASCHRLDSTRRASLAGIVHQIEAALSEA